LGVQHRRHAQHVGGARAELRADARLIFVRDTPETTANAIKHARAKRISLTLKVSNTKLIE
jgi:signal transduction histidine kinase